MQKSFKWLAPVAAFAVCLPVAWWLTKQFHGVPYFSWAITFLVVGSVIFAQTYIRKFPLEQNVHHTSHLLSKLGTWALVFGIVLIPSPFLWLYFMFGHVANTRTGALVLFGPSFLLLLASAGFVLFGVLVWFWARKK